ncbi:ferritin-like domain-containing protein [Pannus brasiliensis CCIBt3594]|uniref:Ferritin-like domain-containing protein n=1 Tax=Pannus brasiliensis CCIBt3594 TaxID=1427578 RepID=A0AAW9QQ72_9CHRO
MNLFTHFLNVLGNGAVAYITARQIRDTLTRPNLLAGFQLAESGAVPFLEKLRDRARDEGDEWLAEKLDRHASDEKRHGMIFARGLKQMGKQVIDFKDLPKDDSKQRRSPFFDAYFQGYTAEDLKAENIDWIVFMGSTYILELDACKDFDRMARALPIDLPRERALREAILSVSRDESRHAAYLHEALRRRLPEHQVETIIEEWRERKIKAMFAMVGNFIEKGGKTTSIVKDGAPTEMEAEFELEPAMS